LPSSPSYTQSYVLVLHNYVGNSDEGLTEQAQEVSGSTVQILIGKNLFVIRKLKTVYFNCFCNLLLTN
jgi:hypothetical protein